MKTFTKLSWLQSDIALRRIQFVAGVIAIVIVFWKLQFLTSAICCGDADGYYHVKWAHELWESMKNRSFVPPFPWLPLTSLNPKDYVDHHLLFHIFQIPFVSFGDPRVGAKISSIVFGSLALISCYWLLTRYNIRYLLVWLIALLACSQPFLFRMNMAKAPPFAILYLIIAVHLFFRKKYWPLAPLALIFTWTYDLFVLLLLATVVWVAVIAWTERRFEWRPLVWVAAGTIGGLVINPYFPLNFQLLYEHLRIKVTLQDFDVKVGNEWYPYDSWVFFGNSVVACTAMVAGYIAFDPSDKKRAYYPLFFLIFSTALMIMTARWRRMAEYWPPFAVLFAAFSLQPWLQGASSTFTRLPADVLDELKPFLDREDPDRPKLSDTDELFRTIAVAFVALLLSVVLFLNLRATVIDMGNIEQHDHYRAGANWMRANIPPHQIVFNTNWDDFPRLFYFDSSHYYVSGLDPNYLFNRDPDLSRLYERITLGQEENPGPLIRDRFGARYVFSDNNHHDFFANARNSGWFDIVYEDKQCTIMFIRDEKLGTVKEPTPTPPGGEGLLDGQPGGLIVPTNSNTRREQE